MARVGPPPMTTTLPPATTTTAQEVLDMDKIPGRLRSRKFWLAVMGALMSVAMPVINGEVPPERGLEAAAAVLVSYILGQAYQDGKAAE